MTQHPSKLRVIPPQLKSTPWLPPKSLRLRARFSLTARPGLPALEPRAYIDPIGTYVRETTLSRHH